MGELKDLDVSGVTIDNLPSGTSSDTVDDQLAKLDGTDPGEFLHPSDVNQGMPSAKELAGTPAELPDNPTGPAELDTDGEPEVAAAPETAPGDTEMEEYTEADALRDAGVEDYETIADYARENNEAFEAMRATFQKANVPLLANNWQELAVELSQMINAPAPPQQEPKPQGAEPALTGLDDVYAKWDGVLDLSETYQKFLGDFARTVSAPLRAEIEALKAQTNIPAHVDATANLALDRSLYAEAKAKASDDDYVPSFAEARRLLTPEARQRALERYQMFGREQDNPFNIAFAQARAAKNGTGLSRGAAKKQAEDNKKIARFTRAKTGTSGTPKGTQPKEGNLAAEIAAVRKLPVSVLERR